jgi:hypothetical protein
VSDLPTELTEERRTGSSAGGTSAVAADNPDDDAREPAVGPRATPFNAYAVVLTALMTATFLMFLLIEPTPRWLLIFGAGLAVVGTEGTLRATWREPFRAPGTGISPYLFLPGLYALATPIVIEHNVMGYWVILAGLAAGAGFGAIVFAELGSVRPRAPDYGAARTVATGGAYFTAFALYSLIYVFDLAVPSAMLAIALVTAMLSIEIYREGEVDPLETLAFAAVTGLIVAEVRWALHFMPIDGYLAGLGLVLAFFLVSGLVHSHLARRLDAIAVLEHALITALGVALVVAARASGVA